MKPYYEADGITIYHGDSQEVVPGLGLSLSAAVVSDPPYGMRWDADSSRFTAGPRTHGAGGGASREAIEGDALPFDPAPWLAFHFVILWGFNHFAARLPVGSTLVWIKRFDAAFGSFLSDAELAFEKGGHGVYCRRDTSMCGDARSRSHPNQKPLTLMSWCVDRTEGLVLDPFMGSGTTLRAAKDLGRQAIGVEIDERYCEIAAKRLSQGVLNFASA